MGQVHQRLDGLERSALVRIIETCLSDTTVCGAAVVRDRSTLWSQTKLRPQMDYAPDAALRIAVLAYLPLAFTEHLQAGAVDQQAQRVTRPQSGQGNLQVLCVPAQGRVVRYRQLCEAKLAQTHDEALPCSQRQMEHLVETEQYLDDSDRRRWNCRRNALLLQRQRPGRGACRAAGKPNFHSTYYELAVAIARTSTTIEQHVQETLRWAREYQEPTRQPSSTA